MNESNQIIEIFCNIKTIGVNAINFFEGGISFPLQQQ